MGVSAFVLGWEYSANMFADMQLAPSSSDFDTKCNLNRQACVRQTGWHAGGLNESTALSAPSILIVVRLVMIILEPF